MIRVALGIDIGGTNTKLALVTEKGHLVETSRFSTRDCHQYDLFLQNLKSHIHKLEENAKERGLEMLGYGLGIPNYNPLSGFLESPPNLPWGSVHFKKDMESLFSRPIFIDNDANIAAIGEGIFGDAQGIENYMVITVGTGIGTGIIVNNKILHGHTGIAGEGGHLCIIPNGRACGCGGFGHFESYCSVTGIKETYREQNNEEIHYRELFPLFLKGEEKAVKVFQETAKYFGLALSSLAVLFSPQVMILAGGGMTPGKKFMTLIQNEFEKQIYPPLKGRVSLVLSEKEVLNGAVLGASALVFSSLAKR